MAPSRERADLRLPKGSGIIHERGACNVGRRWLELESPASQVELVIFDLSGQSLLRNLVRSLDKCWMTVEE